MFTLLIIAISLLLVLSAWYIRAIVVTYKQGVRIIDLIFEQDNHEAYLDEFNRVMTDHHFWRVLTLRNPYTLYGPNIQRLLAEEAAKKRNAKAT
ncbi:MAG: hypothetical protein EBQ80_01795 [Proteobacteria bacterium]|nr:hypothetical protein [Pseudomonadota bacterium]